MSESALSMAIRVEASKGGHRLFRNNVGVLKDERGQHVAYGLAVGSSDLIGWTRDGLFAAIEIKRPGHRTDRKRLAMQQAFVSTVLSAGGRAAIVETVEAAMAELTR